MNGERTGVILGAGASRCYQRGHGQMPLQSDMAARLFMGISRTGNISLGSVAMSSGLRHSERLGVFLRDHFRIGEPRDNSRLEFWKHLQARGYTLESLYTELRRVSVGGSDWVADEFEAIVRTVVSETVNRSATGVCDFHRALVRALEPGDYIVNFNWDTLASDALYHCSRLWFPVTGFGQRVAVLPKYPADGVPGESHVTLLHVHGSVALYTLVDGEGQERGSAVYVPPETYNTSSSMFETLRLPECDLPDRSAGAMRDPTIEESTRFNAGWIRLPSGEWLKPLFVPPSSDKPQYEDWYHKKTIRALHALLPGTRGFVLAGYSVPAADLTYLDSMFVPDVVERDAKVTVVNRDNDSGDFRARVDSMFPGVAAREYSYCDFGDFCRQFMDEDEKRDGKVGTVPKP